MRRLILMRSFLIIAMTLLFACGCVQCWGSSCLATCTGCGPYPVYNNVPVCDQCICFVKRYVLAKYADTFPHVDYAYQLWGQTIQNMYEIADNGTNIP